MEVSSRQLSFYEMYSIVSIYPSEICYLPPTPKNRIAGYIPALKKTGEFPYCCHGRLSPPKTPHNHSTCLECFSKLVN